MYRPSHEVQLWSDRGLFGPLAEAVVHVIWRLLKFGGAPIGNALAFLLWCGLTIGELTALVFRLCRRVARWLSASCQVTFWGGNGFSSKRYHLAFVFIMATSALSALGSSIHHRFSSYLRRRNGIIGKMHDAQSQKEWAQHAAQLKALDRAHGRNKSASIEAKLFNAPLLQRKTLHLKQLFQQGDMEAGEMIRRLREDLVRKLGNMQDTSIYDYYGRIPEPIEEYIVEVQRCLKHIVSSENLSDHQKLNFLQETRHAFGRTALLLSGGGSLGAYHLGVAKVLLESNLLPRIICGSSVGAIVAGILGCHTTEELCEWMTHMEDIDLQFFSSSSTRQFLGSLLMRGHMHDGDHLCKKLEKLLGDLTFLEAYEKTGRVLNVVVCSANADEPPRVLNYLTAPQVLVWSAVAASSAFPGLFPPQDIRSRASDGSRVCFAMADCRDVERRWRDGSLEDDLPIQTLREMFNVNYFLVSQTNPHIVPLLNLRSKLNKRIATAIEIEWKHRCRQLEWLLPEWVPTKWLRLFSQTWEGDVTMVLPLSDYWSLLRALVNPSKEEMLTAVHLGEVSTWEKLAAIECNCAIEKSLDASLVSVVESLKAKSGASKATLTSRIPSWLHLPVLGIPKVESMESLLAFEGTLNPTATFTPPVFPRSPEGSIVDGHPSIDCLDTSAPRFNVAEQMKHIPSGNALNYIAP